MSKEATYDGQIASAMTHIIKVCKENDIDMIASFELDWSEEHESTLKCTTLIAPRCKVFQKACKIIRDSPAPEFSAFVITTRKDSDGE